MTTSQASTSRRGVAGLALGAGLVALVCGARPIAHKAVFPGADSAFPSDERLGLRAPGASLLHFVARDGTALVAAWVPARGGGPNPAASTVVYFHMTNQAAADALPFAADLAGRGVNVLLPEHRGYGGLGGRPSTAGLLLDAEAALDAAGLDPEATVLVGRSLGAATATEMARRGRGRALVLVSPFTSVDDVAGPARFAIRPTDRIDVASALREVDVPVTILHGTRDRLIPFRMGASLAAAHPRARLVALEGAGHNDLFLGPRATLLDEIALLAEGTR